jgi:hypothetical protein
MHPKNCLQNQPSAACNLKRGNNTWGVRFYHDCFPTVNDFVRSLTRQEQHKIGQEELAPDHGNYATASCSKMALDTLQGKGPDGPTNHMFYNYLFLANLTTMVHPNKEIMVVRQESLWDDMRRVEGILGGNPMRPFETEGPVVTHGSEKFPHRATLDPFLVPLLCCALNKEIHVYMELLTRAINIDLSEKQHAIKRLSGKCNVDSLKALSTKCHSEEQL